MIYTPEVRKAIKDLSIEMSGSMTRAEAERTFQSEALKRVSDETKIPKKVLRSIARMYHNQNFDQRVAETDEVETVYTEVFELNKNSI